jgi:C4-type Zn-finger protein
MSDRLNEFNTKTGCPKCGSPLITLVKYTWWGGMLGPKMFHHTKCEMCKYRFNSKTRQSNTTAIIIYSLILFIAAFGAYYFFSRS